MDIQNLTDEQLLDIIDQMEKQKALVQGEFWRNTNVTHRNFQDDYERADLEFENNSISNKLAPYIRERNKRGISFSALYRKKFGL